MLHNTCEDSLLASPIILDLVILCELCERISIKRKKEGDDCYVRFHAVLSLLSYLLKAPLVPNGAPVVNALSAQRQVLMHIVLINSLGHYTLIISVWLIFSAHVLVCPRRTI